MESKSMITEDELYEEVNKLENVRSLSFVDTPKARIQLMHSVFPSHTIIPILQMIPDSELKNEVDDIIDEINTSKTNLARKHIRELALKYQPKTINNLIWLYKFGISEFFIEDSTYDLNALNLLNDIFKIKVDFDNNPLHLHLITKEILELQCLKDSHRNKIYFAKTISTLSRLALYLSMCIIWSVFFSIIGIENDMYRFHKFSEMTHAIKQLNCNEFKDKEKDFYFFLECISYLLNIITDSNISEKVDSCYLDYFKYSKDDTLSLKRWCGAANRNFDVKVVDNKFNLDSSLISDLLELDIMVALENLEITNDTVDF